MATEGFIPTEGLQYLAETSLSEEQSVPANFYVGLSQHNFVKSDTLSGNGTGWTEVTGTGYARQTVASSAVGIESQTDGGTDWEAVLAKVTFTATGADWDAATDWFVATTNDNSGKIVSCGRLAATRQLAVSGDKLEVTPTIPFASVDPNA